MKRLLARLALVLILAAALLYLGDDAIWQLRGKPTATVHVTRIVVAPLKGNREEYYPDGVADLACSRSIFRQAGSGPCWRLQRNSALYDR